jgi:hypothetical protein
VHVDGYRCTPTEDGDAHVFLPEAEHAKATHDALAVEREEDVSGNVGALAQGDLG